jgi:hypothetical protein
MGWASNYIERLRAGETVSFRPRGHSMSPRIKSGQLCTVEPVAFADLAPGDVVLCRVGGHEYLHLVIGILSGSAEIGNNHGRVNGWAGPSRIFGRLVKVEP